MLKFPTNESWLLWILSIYKVTKKQNVPLFLNFELNRFLNFFFTLRIVWFIVNNRLPILQKWTEFLDRCPQRVVARQDTQCYFVCWMFNLRGITFAFFYKDGVSICIDENSRSEQAGPWENLSITRTTVQVVNSLKKKNTPKNINIVPIPGSLCIQNWTKMFVKY